MMLVTLKPAIIPRPSSPSSLPTPAHFPLLAAHTPSSSLRSRLPRRSDAPVNNISFSPLLSPAGCSALREDDRQVHAREEEEEEEEETGYYSRQRDVLQI
ncbi:hypothetical protein E2C01_003074 [Portunus trituberculatus]|uniref:Uncharacterized protein n=1 Tax=Portunus trituberculatus TaxID=210409 RepID=A0A5B7CLL8_PORTR|nr:hypothetical protein [Portunus trituberculatus]